MRLLNLGCGTRVHPDWENVDFVVSSPGVRAHDLTNGIPYPDSFFDVVYHSHLLEHFPRRLAPEFLKECYRVLKRGGVIRVAIPDLEAIARLYLEALERSSRGCAEWRARYDWILLEMYDQAVRESSAGGCCEYIRQHPISSLDFVLERWGAQAGLLVGAAQSQDDGKRESRDRPHPIAWGYVLRNLGSVLRDKVIKAILGRKDWRALKVGRFRQSGEVHMWMYDAYSLRELLGQTGFIGVGRRTAIESRIPGWQTYHLDTEPNGAVYKPDSLYMEGVKP